ncbi:hypothetical protein K3G69_14905 [Phytobacter diazotrophicus]|nr:hypothetical protein [Phytobacter diazotrophicus]
MKLGTTTPSALVAKPNCTCTSNIINGTAVFAASTTRTGITSRQYPYLSIRPIVQIDIGIITI